jgi:nephrocystin-3
MPAPNELRLFLSSTFIDFQGERDYLSKKVFPALRRLCRERGVEFTEIDLRWGLTNEDAEQGRILGTCFEEVDNCRPFFIGLLGERYGWVPPIEELMKNPELRNQHPWLEAAMQQGPSATELEFRHGFLNHGFGETKPLVYFRSPAASSRVEGGTSTDDRSPTEDPRIKRLKEEVTASLGSVPVFHSPAELGTLIEHDLTALIERHWPASEKVSWIDEERAGHAAFAQSRRKGYVANPSLVDTMNAHLEQPESVLILTGESGSGKSSLLAHWAETLRNRDSKLFVIEHYVGVTAASTDPDTLMRRIVTEIRERTHSDDPIPPSSAELAQAFPSWLGRISEERMVILIDAINQFNTEGRFLIWLPDHVSSNVKWVISSTQSEALQRVRDHARALSHAWPEVAVKPITLPERRRVLRTFLAGFQKKLDPKQEDKIVKNKKSSSPLFLRTLLEELRLQGKHESLDRFIKHYLASSDIPDLFSRILERVEQDYGADEVRALLTRIWAAPHGLAESEIIESSQLDRAGLSLLLHAFDYHLIRLQGRLSFFHDHLRQAVEGRYLDTTPKKQDAWVELASYFRSAEPSSIKALSQPWLWRRAERWQQLKQTLLDVALLPYLTEGSRSYDLLGYWLELEKRQAQENANASKENGAAKSAKWNIDVVAEYEAAIADNASALDAAMERDMLYALGLFFRNAGWHAGAVSMATKALALYNEDQLNDQSSAHDGSSAHDRSYDDPDTLARITDLYLELGKAYLDMSDLKNASQTLNKAMQLQSGDETNFDIRQINVRDEYARLLKEEGKYQEAERVARVTLKAAIERFGPKDSTVQNQMRLLAEILAFEAKYPEAESLYRDVLKSIEASLGSESLDAGYYLNVLANFLRQTGGDYEEARQLFERAVAIIESRLGKNHPDLSTLLRNFATLHSRNGNWEQAEPLFLRSLAIDEVAHGPEHPKTAASLNNYAGMLYRQGKYDLAENPYRRALDIKLKVLGKNHPETAFSFTNLGNLLRRQGNYQEAEECYARALEIQMATLGPMHEVTGQTLEAYGRFMRIKGDLPSAEDFLIRSYNARKECFGPEHHDTIFIALALVLVLLEQAPRDTDKAEQRELDSLPAFAERAKSIVNEVIKSAGSDGFIIVADEVLKLLGENRAIGDEIRRKFENLVNGSLKTSHKIL